MAREIPLTQGKVAIVDDEDYEYLNQYKWHAKVSKSGTYYPARSEYLGGGKKYALHATIRMHQELVDYDITDHINRNPLDNRRENLREATREENGANRDKCRSNTSGVKGVVKEPKCERWRAQITVDGLTRYLGLFKTPEEAQAAYLEAARKHFGEFATAG